jgi:type IV secretory pathway TraG/TraD family ATPase VirD4
MKIDPYLRRPDQTVELHGTGFPLEYLFRGMLITGQPGSGKTRMVLMPLIRSILTSTGTHPDEKACLVVADPKNELAPFIANELAAIGRQDDLVTLKPGSAHYNPLANPFLSSNEMVERIIALANNTHRSSGRQSRGDEMFWANAQRGLISAMIATTRALHGDIIDFRQLYEVFRKVERFRSLGESTVWMRENKLPTEATTGIGDYLKLPADTTRACVTSTVANTLYFWRNEPLAQLTSPSPDSVSIDPFDIVQNGKVLVIGCAGAAFGASITPLILAIKEHLFSTLLARDQIEIRNGNEWTLINQRRPVFFIADEFQAYLSVDSSTGELTALDRLRGFNAGYIAATQNLASLHSVLGDAAHATRLISLFANQAYLANICPMTASQAEHILGEKTITERHSDRRPRMAPPLLLRPNRRSCLKRRRTGIDVTRAAPRVDAQVLAKMRTGEFWLRLANAKTVRVGP